jgi:hypothetical protein
MILVGEASLQRAVGEVIVHCHRERHHQELGNRLIVLLSATPLAIAFCLVSGPADR